MFYYIVRIFGFGIRCLPVEAGLCVGRFLGGIVYHLDGKHRRIVLMNLRIAFGDQKSADDIHDCARAVFQNYGQNIIELLRMPVMTPAIFQRYVRLEGREHISEALQQKKGLILLAMHFGSWELSNLINTSIKHPYNVIVKPQTRYSRLDQLLNSYRECGGTVTIQRGMETRDLIRRLKRNEIVAMVMDQGGKDGIRVPFFSRQASMSAGAIRIGLKMGVPICFAVITRVQGPHHQIDIHPPMTLITTGHPDEDIRTNVARVARIMEGIISRHPAEYMWFYKIWKYTQEATILILNDGRTGHLRQSQAVAGILQRILSDRGHTARIKTIDVSFSNEIFARLGSLLCALRWPSSWRRRQESLKGFLSAQTYEQILATQAGFVISCGSRVAALNSLIARDLNAKNVTILKPGPLSFDRFSMVILPEHDLPVKKPKEALLATTRGALNVISPEYLQGQRQALLRRFSHLKDREQTAIGVFIGGDTRAFPLDEKKMRIVIHHLTEVAREVNADLLVTTSRRTPASVENLLYRELKRHPRCPLLILANRQNVPEAMGGILALSDIAVVSGDSISMISEAATSGRQTVVFKPYRKGHLGGAHKHDRFIEGLNRQGYVLSANVRTLKQAVYDLAKNKIQTKRLDDHSAIKTALEDFL